MNEPANVLPEVNSRVAKQCEYLAEKHGAQVLRPVYQFLTASIGDESLTGLDAPGPDANPVDQARFLVKLLGPDDALRAVEGAVREYGRDRGAMGSGIAFCPLGLAAVGHKSIKRGMKSGSDRRVDRREHPRSSDSLRR